MTTSPLYDDNRKWLQISSNPAVWTWCKPQETFFDFRMTAFRLTDNTLLVYSPVPDPGEQCLLDLTALGDVSCILAPSHFHNLGIKLFLSRWPKTRLLAPTPARTRLKRVTGHEFSDIASIRDLLPPGIKLRQTEGLKGAEIWIHIHSALGNLRAPAVCDSFFHMHNPKRGFFRIMMFLVGGMPGLRVSRMFKKVAGMNRSTYGAWTRRELAELRPTMLIPTHGDILVDPALTVKLIALL